ncbi:MAG: right-handed parallel beta-helix repeat-containing protein [Planctomycetes bacterium]|nr:right-handed parallel beta-helix repeat-containing protein [Planctomycetota bacterium]
MAAGVLALAMAFPSVEAGGPLELVVTSTADDGIDANPGNEVCETIPGNGDCTLRAAVMEANGNPGPDTIYLQVGAVYVLTRPNPLTPDQDLVGSGGDLDLVNNDVTIVGNGATIDGNATERIFHVAGNVTADIYGLTIRNGRDANGGGIYNLGRLTLTDCTITGNEATTSGGGIYTSGGVLTLNHTTVSYNRYSGTAQAGGGIYVASGTANLDDSLLVANVGLYGADGILNRGTLTVRRTLVADDELSNGGAAGAVIPGGTVVIEDCLFDGGFVDNWPPGNLTVRRSTIQGSYGGMNNEAGATMTLETTMVRGVGAAGTAVRNQGTLTVRSNCVIRDNVVGFNTASAILNIGSQSNAQIIDSTIRNNRPSASFSEAPAILNRAGGRLTITNSVIAGNTGGNFGGGILNNHDAAQLTISGCTIRDNRSLSAVASGIGVFTASAATITDTVFRGNIIGGLNHRGGGLGSSGPLTLRDCTFVGNQADQGGALHMAGGSATIERCAFHGNTSGLQRGAVVIVGPTTTMTNCTISGNLGNQGGGLVSGPGTTLTNLTIFGNNGHGLTTTIPSGASVQLRNSIISGNTVRDCVLVGPLASGGGNLDGDGTCGLTDPADLPDTDPMLGPLAANGGLSLTHRPLFGSLAIDAANDATCAGHDQRNYGRPADGDNDGSVHCDIGAYEQQFADCDQNGVFDLIDVGQGTLPDDNNNGVPDGCEVIGDIDGNGVVNLADHSRFRRCFDGPGSSAVSICTRVDTDGDGDVDLADFADVQLAFNSTP